MKRLIPAGLILVIIVAVMIFTQPAPQKEEFLMPIVVEAPAPSANESIDVKGARIAAGLDESISEYYEIIYSLKHAQDPLLKGELLKYHNQWIDENAYKFYNYRNFIQTNFQEIESEGLNPAEMLADVNSDIKVMENNRKILQWNNIKEE